jgi:mediator of RNA polymerase II transcription subunit 17, fungi type
MAAPPSATAPSFSLRPWPTGDRKPKNLAEFIARVNAERGAFRNVTEESLKEEIRVREQEDPTGADDVEMAGSEAGEQDEETEAKDLNAARNEMLKNIEYV